MIGSMSPMWRYPSAFDTATSATLRGPLPLGALSRIGFLARELLDEIPHTVATV